jgi:hypothetical protein
MSKAPGKSQYCYLELVITAKVPLCSNLDYKLHTIQRALHVVNLEVTVAY